MKPLRVCIFTETYYPVVGGGETQAQILAERLVASGHEVIVITRRSDRLLKKQEKVGAVTVYRLPPVGGGQFRKWGLLFTSFPALVFLRKQFDLLFVSGFRMIGIPALLASKVFHKACVFKADSQGEMSGEYFTNGLQKHGISSSWLPFRAFLSLRNKIFQNADAFVAISAGIVAELSANGIEKKKIFLNPNGVDTARFFPVSEAQKRLLRRKMGLPQSTLNVIYTGRLVSYKGLPLLLRVWQEICDKHDHARLVLVGSGGLDMHNCEAELRSFVHAAGMEQKILFTGNVQNVHEYLQASDIFVFPTEDDAFPSSIIEAMACALPVITTPVGAIKTIVTDGQDGIIVQPGSFEQLFEALDRLIEETTLASQLGNAGLGKVRTHYSADIVTANYISLFHKLLTPSASFSLKQE